MATPVGQRSVWHFWDWMQPIASIASRATLTMSAPSANATTALSGIPHLPEAMKVMSSERPASAKTPYTREKPSRNGSAIESLKISGEAPVPPSPPSTVMKSTPRCRLPISSASLCQNAISPTADLMPTGRPVPSATRSTKSSSESTSENAECRDGDAQSTPSGMPRISEISLLTLAAGSSPPRPGFAPCDSLISIARIGADSTTALSFSRSKCPSSSRQPKYDVPICSTRSPPCRWYGDSPPSPVLCMQPACLAPALSALIALPDIDPKLIAEMFTTERGRNALARPRGPPSTFALGRSMSWAWWPRIGGTSSAKVRCLMIA